MTIIPINFINTFSIMKFYYSQLASYLLSVTHGNFLYPHIIIAVRCLSTILTLCSQKFNFVEDQKSACWSFANTKLMETTLGVQISAAAGNK